MQAGIDELDDIVDLFDKYRVFYKQYSDKDGARKFLTERFVFRDTVILLARENGTAVGFAHLFPSFTSTGMRRIGTVRANAPFGNGAWVGRAHAQKTQARKPISLFQLVA